MLDLNPSRRANMCEILDMDFLRERDITEIVYVAEMRSRQNHAGRDLAGEDAIKMAEIMSMHEGLDLEVLTPFLCLMQTYSGGLLLHVLTIITFSRESKRF